MTTLTVDNPTKFPTNRYMVWGSKTPYNPVQTLPGGHYINAGRLSIPPGRDTLTLPPPEALAAFEAHPAVLSAWDAGWAPTFNGVKFQFERWIWYTPHHTCMEWTCLVPNGVIKLWTYLGNKDNLMHYSGRVYCESLDSPDYEFTKMEIGCSTDDAVIRPGYLIQGLPSTPTTLHDGQGLPFDGQFIFFDQLIGPEILSSLAAHEAMPIAFEAVEEWGPMDVLLPSEAFTVPAQSLYNYLTYKQQSDPFFFWPGVGNAKQGGQTGHQPGFGVWDHLDWALTGSPSYTYPDFIRAGQEACRPGHYFEPGTGKIFDPVARAPDCVTWDGVLHWHLGVGRDRIGRAHNVGQTASWTGQDRQHMNMKFLSEQVLIYGCQASAHELKHRAALMLGNLTVSIRHGATSPNGPIVGRDGRVWQAVADMYNATGDIRLIQRMKEHLIEFDIPMWKKNVFGPFNITRIISNDDHTFGQGKQGWFVWEDAIQVQGLVVLAQALRDAGELDYALTVETQASKMARSIILHGYTPDGRQIAKAVLFNDGQNLGIHTGVPLTASQWTDRNFAIPADGTDYKYWAIPCLDFAKGYFTSDVEIQNRILEIEKHMESDEVLMGQTHRRNFLGFGEQD